MTTPSPEPSLALSCATLPAGQVQPITARPIRRPQYRNEWLGNFREWYRDNEPALTQYWNELGGYGEASEADDFVEFAATQYDLQGNLPAVADLGWL